jgi:hypothetical protein
MGQSAQFPEFTPFGTAFAPIGHINGKAIWPVLGGATEGENGNEDGSQGGSENAGGTGQGAGDGSGNGDGSGGDGQGANADGDQRSVTREEFDRLRAQLSAADKNKSEAQKELDAAKAKLKQFEDKDRTELEKAQNDLQEATKKATELETKLRDFQIVEAFRAASEAEKPPLNWHNTKVAMGQLNSGLYEIKDDGSVTGMDKAVKALAKDHDYLLKKEQSGGGGKSGGSFNNGSGAGTGNLDRKKLEGKYPGLRGRGGN